MISDDTAALLSELLIFRHFKRYYFDFDHDWDRIEFVCKKFDRLRPLVEAALDSFTGFLRRLAEEADKPAS